MISLVLTCHWRLSYWTGTSYNTVAEKQQHRKCYMHGTLSASIQVSNGGTLYGPLMPKVRRFPTMPTRYRTSVRDVSRPTNWQEIFKTLVFDSILKCPLSSRLNSIVAVRQSYLHKGVLSPQRNLCTGKAASLCCNKLLLSNCGYTRFTSGLKKRASLWNIYPHLEGNAPMLVHFGIFTMENTHLYHNRLIGIILSIIALLYRVY